MECNIKCQSDKRCLLLLFFLLSCFSILVKGTPFSSYILLAYYNVYSTCLSINRYFALTMAIENTLQTCREIVNECQCRK